MGVKLPRGHEHAYNETVLRIEEEEYRLADYLLCPSDFVVKPCKTRGSRLKNWFVIHTDSTRNCSIPTAHRALAGPGLRVLFVGVCAVRKGLHFALEAWLRTSAPREEGRSSSPESLFLNMPRSYHLCLHFLAFRCWDTEPTYQN